jgi:hypothetical protein
LRVRVVLALGGLIAGCTALAGVEDEYSPRHAAEVQASGGAQSATGGSSGGSIEAGAATGGGEAGGTACGPGLKLCGGSCRPPDALIGCSSQGCEPCPVATNAEAYCEGEQCKLRCKAGFSGDSNGQCMPNGSGGSGGGGGAGGTGGGAGGSGGGGTGGATACTPSACPPCPLMPPLSASCCLPNSSCGFMYPGQPCTACGQ